MAADAAAPTPANQGSASAAGAEFTDEDHHQDPLGNGDLLTGPALLEKKIEHVRQVLATWRGM